MDAGADKAARRISEDWKSGCNTGDVAMVTARYPEDGYCQTELCHRSAARTGQYQGSRSTLESVPDIMIDSIQIITTDCSADLAYAVGKYQATNAGQKALGLNLVVLTRLDHQWRIVTPGAAVPDPATAIQRLDGARMN